MAQGKKTATKTKAKTTTKTRRASKPRTKKPVEMEYTNGKFEDVEEKHEKAKGIEELLALPKNPFGTASYEELEASLEGMNLRQMQELAVKASVFPSGNKTSLRNKIRREFKVKFGSKDGAKRYTSESQAPIVDPESKLAKEVLEILNGK
jgi:hypothetical protein